MQPVEAETMTIVRVDTDESFPFLRDDFDWDRDYLALLHTLEQDGYAVPPDWMPIPLPGYEWRCVAMMTPMMRPKPRWRHWLRYRVWDSVCRPFRRRKEWKLQ